MYAFRNLPEIYKIAVMLGARVEVFLESEEKWFSHTEVTGISSDDLYRIVAEDENILEQAKILVNQLYTKIIFNEYTYMVPNNALKEGNIILMLYGLGIYVQVQKDITLKVLERHDAREILEATGKYPYYSHSETLFYRDK